MFKFLKLYAINIVFVNIFFKFKIEFIKYKLFILKSFFNCSFLLLYLLYKSSYKLILIKLLSYNLNNSINDTLL